MLKFYIFWIFTIHRKDELVKKLIIEHVDANPLAQQQSFKLALALLQSGIIDDETFKIETTSSGRDKGPYRRNLQNRNFSRLKGRQW